MIFSVAILAWFWTPRASRERASRRRSSLGARLATWRAANVSEGFLRTRRTGGASAARGTWSGTRAPASASSRAASAARGAGSRGPSRTPCGSRSMLLSRWRCRSISKQHGKMRAGQKIAGKQHGKKIAGRQHGKKMRAGKKIASHGQMRAGKKIAGTREMRAGKVRARKVLAGMSASRARAGMTGMRRRSRLSRALRQMSAAAAHQEAVLMCQAKRGQLRLRASRGLRGPRSMREDPSSQAMGLQSIWHNLAPRPEAWACS